MNLVKTPRYKIKIADIAPKLITDTKYSDKKCYLGISINNPFFWGKHVDLLLKWISDHFDSCLIIIGDHLHRLNEYILNGISGQEAIDAGLKLGDEALAIFSEQIKKYPKGKFEIHRWQTYHDDNKCQQEKLKLTKSCDSNYFFNKSIINSCTEFIDRHIDRGNNPKVTYEKAIQLSKEYLLEEMAVFSILIEQGYTVQVYPGSQLPVLKEFAEHKFEDIESNLRDGIYIDLFVKKKK